MSNLVIQTNELTKNYGKIAALDHVNLEVKRGQIYGLVGRNGAGKTTLLRLLTGQAFKSEGELSLFGATSEEEIAKQRKNIGAIIEIPSFYPGLSAKQNLEYYRIQRGIPGIQCVEEALREVDLLDAKDKKYKGFSLGMKQRLGLALALMNKPDLLLLDEPINGLDPFGIIEIRKLLLRLNVEKKITIVISSHILSELENLVTDYGFINEGKLIKQISAKQLERECTRFLEIKVNEVEKMTALIEQKLGCTNYKVTPDQKIILYEYMDRPYVISELAVKEGIQLLDLHVSEINLEKYFMQLVGGVENA